MAFVRSPKFYVLNGVKELITALIETWTAAEEDSLESLCRKGNAKEMLEIRTQASQYLDTFTYIFPSI